MSEIASVGAQSIFVGSWPDELVSTDGFGRIREDVRDKHGALLIGYRDPITGDDNINPPNDAILPSDSRLIYLAPEPVLPE